MASTDFSLWLGFKNVERIPLTSHIAKIEFNSRKRKKVRSLKIILD